MKTATLFPRLVLGVLLSSVLLGCPNVPDPDPLVPAPRVISFTASATEVAPGSTVKLSWNVENATTIKIEDSNLGLASGVDGFTGETDVAIREDSLFVLTVRNARGVSDTAVVSVRVTSSSQAELLFSAQPTVIDAGDDVTLAWSAPGATGVTITAAPGGAIDLGTQGATGALVLKPTTTTTYTLSAGGRTATTTVSVRHTLLSFTASPDAADAGSTVTLAWQTANATRVQLTAPGRGTLVDEMDAARVAQGSFEDMIPAVVDPGQLFPYRLTVTGAGGMPITRDVVVSVKGNPAVETFTAPKYAARDSDAGVNLTWTTREADGLTISANAVEIYRATPDNVAAGSLALPALAVDTTFTITATNSRGGSASRTALVDVVGPPTVSVTAMPTTLNVGEATTLTWSGTDIRNVRISAPGVGNVFNASDVMDTGTATFGLGATAVLRIDVDNGAGGTASTTTTITATGNMNFTVPPGSVRAGERVDVSWTPAGEVTGLPHDDIVTRPMSMGFEDITTTGTLLPFTSSLDDKPLRYQPTEFAAPFFGRTVGSEVWVHHDGYLTFTQTAGYNYSAVTLPSSKLEPYSIAPCWNDRSSVSVRAIVRDVTGGGRVLIVQWGVAFQVKMYSSGQVDLEYGASPGTCTYRGVRGPYGDDGFSLPAVVANQGFTLFGPKTNSVPLVFRHEQQLAGSLTVAGRPVTYGGNRISPVVQSNEFSISEALVNPAAAVGAPGQWFELYNSSDTAIDLTGWTLGANDGGVPTSLAGVIAPRAVLVVGASTDATLNDDAGVQLALTGAPLGLDAGVVSLGRDGGLWNFTWTAPTQGTAYTIDVGPYRLSTDTSSSAARALVCNATTAFGTLGTQLGTPGAVSHCGFPYTLQEIPGGYFDISATGTLATPANLDDAVFQLPLTGAPFPFFGTPQTVASVSTNGFISFDGTNADLQISTVFPNTTDTNGLLAIMAADMAGYITGMNPSGIFTQRVAQGVDPSAPAPHWIVQWHRWSHFDTVDDTFSDDTDDLNFQIKLFDDGTIEYHFGTMVSGSSLRRGAGLYTSTWLENPTGTQALIVNTRSFAPGISPNTAFRFSPR